MIESCIKRPGGLKLTEQLIAQTNLRAGESVIDVGCGSGATVRLLREQYGLSAYGIDYRWNDEGKTEPYLRRGRAEELTAFYSANSVDAIISECCLSLFDDPKLFLNQSAIVLRKEGWLLLSDVYYSDEGTTNDVAVDARKGVLNEEQLGALLQDGGFRLCSFRDQRPLLQQWLGQGILEMGRESFYRLQGWEGAELPKSRLSYYGLVARKKV